MLSSALLVGGGLLGLAAQRQVPEDPTEAFTKTFTATGLVERVRSLGPFRRTCAVEVATYTWVNLSPGFPLGELPQEGSRYTLRTSRESCRAVQIAAAATGGHILYRAGADAAGRWYLAAPPEPALGCGGLIDWQPPPEPRPQ